MVSTVTKTLIHFKWIHILLKDLNLWILMVGLNVCIRNWISTSLRAFNRNLLVCLPYGSIVDPSEVEWTERPAQPWLHPWAGRRCGRPQLSPGPGSRGYHCYAAARPETKLPSDDSCRAAPQRLPVITPTTSN